MAKDAEELVLSISADTRQILRAMKRLEGDIARSSAGIEKQFASVGKAIDKAMPTDIQNRINKMVGVQSAATKEWTGAMAEQSKEMERLRARFNPMFATVTRYKAAVTEIRAAHRLGAISADEMTAAIQRERQATLAATAAMRNRNAVLAKGRPNAFNTANIAAQFQDIGVTTAMGMNPLTIALQQGTQLSAVLEQMKGSGQSAGQAIAAAFASIISPMSLVTIGVVAAGAAIAQYALSGGSEVEKFDDLLRRHEEIIKSLGPAYKDALVSAREYMADPAVANALHSQNERELAQRIATETAAVARAIDAAVKSAIQTSLGTTTAQTLQEAEAESAFRPFMDAIERLKAGAIDARAFRDEIVIIAQSAPGLTDAASTLVGMVKPVVDMMPALDEAQRGFDAVKVAVGALANQIEQISSAKARKELTEMMEKARDGEVSIKDLLAELARISGYAPDVSGIIGAFKAVAEAATAARDAQVGWTAKASQGGRTRYGGSGFMALPGSAPTPEGRVDPYFQDWRTKEKSARAPKRTPDDRFFEDIEAIKQRTIALAEERAQLGLSYEAQVKRKMAFDLEQKALRDVREAARQKGDQDWQNAQLTPDQIKQIDEVSAAYARQSEELRKAQNQLAFQQDLLRSALGDLKSALADGKLEWEEMGQIALNVLDKITNKLLDDVLAAIFEVNSVGSSGGLLGFLGSLFGGGGFRPNTTAGAFFTNGFASGTANTGGRRGQPIGVVHGQEAVIPLPDNRKVPVQIQGGAGGYNDNRTITIDARGAQQGVGEEIRRALEEYDRGRKARLASDIPDLRRRLGAI